MQLSEWWTKILTCDPWQSVILHNAVSHNEISSENYEDRMHHSKPGNIIVWRQHMEVFSLNNTRLFWNVNEYHIVVRVDAVLV